MVQNNKKTEKKTENCIKRWPSNITDKKNTVSRTKFCCYFIGLLEETLGSFYAPSRPLSDVTVLEFRDSISKLSRRFFHHLLRYTDHKANSPASLYSLIASSVSFKICYCTPVVNSVVAFVNLSLF